MKLRTLSGRILISLLAVTLVAVPVLADPTITGDQSAWAELRAAWVKLHGLSGYRAKLTVAGNMQGVMEFQSPNSYHMTMQTQGGSMESIQVNGKTAVKMNMTGAPAGWQCHDMPQSPGASVPNLQSAQGTWNVTRGPDTTIGGTAVHAINTAYTMPAAQSTVDSTWYIGVQSGLPVRYESKTGGNSSTMDFYDYGAAISIALPACG